LTSIIAVTGKRELKNKTEEETRYFISSINASDPKRLGNIVKSHWGIENNLHWILDQAFDEDAHRTRTGNSAANMAIMRHIVMNLIKTAGSSKLE